MQNYVDKEIYMVIIKIQNYINWISALSFVLFDSFINSLDDGIENIYWTWRQHEPGRALNNLIKSKMTLANKKNCPEALDDIQRECG